jgi:hypothetical protein
MKKRFIADRVSVSRSGEHELSRMATQGILGAMDRERFDIVSIGMAKSISPFSSSTDPRELRSVS